MAFHIVYIIEAHPSDVWRMSANVRQGVVFASPRDYNERRKLNIKIQSLIDTFDNTNERAYTGWPDRLYVIGKDGRVTFKSRPGPFGFHPEDIRKELERLTKPN